MTFIKVVRNVSIKYTGISHIIQRICKSAKNHIRDCPAREKECKACGKQNHFAKQCRSKPWQQQPTYARKYIFLKVCLSACLSA
jgi:hypothetical protein